MTSRAEKALAAAVRYEQAASEVCDLTQQVSKAINQCDIMLDAHDADYPGGDTQELWHDGRVKTHLWQAYRMEDDEQEQFLIDEDCPHCLDAWRLINARREARREFGCAKRAIRALGKAEMRRWGI